MNDWIVQNKEFAEALSYWGTFLGTVVLSVGGVFALWKHRSDHRQQRLIQARASYQDYMKFSIDYPEYFEGFWERKDLTDLDRIKYFGFIAYTLTAMEEIVDLDPRPEWQATIRADLRTHQSFLASETFQKTRNCYFSSMQRLIDDVVNERDLDHA